jgi:hypothetical protein
MRKPQKTWYLGQKKVFKRQPRHPAHAVIETLQTLTEGLG